MSIELVTVLLFGGLLFLLAAGVPVTFSLGGISVLVIFLLEGPSGLYAVATTAYNQMTAPGLMTIPLFTFMGNLLSKSGIADRLFKSLNYWLTNISGGLAIVSLGVCVALAMCSGFGPGLLTMGLIAVPAMLKQSYDKSIALGSVMAGGVLGTIIPPSIIMIIFGYIGRISIGKLFLGGVVPGFLTAFLYFLYIGIRCHYRPELAPASKIEIDWKTRIIALKEIILPSALVLGVLGSIFLGIATPTEAAGVGAMGAMIICMLYGKLNWNVLRDSTQSTFTIAGMVMWILIAATLFGVVYKTAGAQQMVMDLVDSLPVSRWMIIIGMQLILFVFGMFMDDYAVVTICAPIFLPIASLLGFDPIWFSIVFLLNMQVAYLTPPFGWALILMKGVAPSEVQTKDLWLAVPPFVIIQLIILILAMLFPQLATWLPEKML